MSRIFVMLLAITLGFLAAQLPEFAQQYRQRLGGAIDELASVVAKFDEDARSAGLNRTTAIETYGQTNEPFLTRRGLSMEQAIVRLNRLKEHSARIDLSEPVLRPARILTEPDLVIARGTADDYEPAVPATMSGMIYGVAGLLAGFALGMLILLPFRLGRRQPRRRSVEPY